MALRQGPGRLGSLGVTAAGDPDSDSGSDIELYSDLLHDATDHADVNASKEFVDLVKLLPRFELTLPEQLVRHHLQRAGCSPADTVVTRLVAVAAQKFAWDVLEGALYYERQREQSAPADDAAAGDAGGVEGTAGGMGGLQRGTTTTLTREALVLSLREHNVSGLDGKSTTG